MLLWIWVGNGTARVCVRNASDPQAGVSPGWAGSSRSPSRDDPPTSRPPARRSKKKGKRKKPLPPIRINLSNCKYEVCE